MNGAENVAVGPKASTLMVTVSGLTGAAGPALSEMLTAAERLEFERAAAIRDRIEAMRGNVGQKVSEVEVDRSSPRGKRGKRGSQIPRPKRGSRKG